MKKNLYNLLNIKTQHKTAKYIRKFLRRNKIPFYTDKIGNIFNFDNSNVALISSHMDTVVEYVPEKHRKSVLQESTLKDGTTILKGVDVIGADDKCGIYLTLRLLKEREHPINFVFSRDEEVGCIGIKEILSNPKNINQIRENCLYCLVLDRHGSKDICCSYNDYGTKEFEDALVETSVANGFEYRPSNALYSDADFLSNHISTANLSVGYYNEHTAKEKIVLEELETAYEYVRAILYEVKEKYEAPKKVDNIGYFDEYDYFMARNEFQDDYPDWGDFPTHEETISANDFLELTDLLAEHEFIDDYLI